LVDSEERRPRVLSVEGGSRLLSVQEAACHFFRDHSLSKNLYVIEASIVNRRNEIAQAKPK
jgi:hypothetical protein